MSVFSRNKAFEICPAVCSAGENYIICVPTPVPVLMSVFVGEEEFTNDVCGVKITSCYVQKFTIPIPLLNMVKQYKVSYEIIYREAYCSQKEAPVSKTFLFRPIEKTEDIRIYHLSDVHGKKAAALKAGSYFGEGLDLLILNGDISSSTQTVSESLLPLKIAASLTKGEIPCIITRGNHDLRGKYAERISEFYPLDHGKFYYSVQLGPIWFLVLDCGEDKNDDHREYAGTVAFHKYRQKETAFLKELADAHACSAPDIRYKILVSHIPFMHTDYDPEKKIHEFDIEIDTYTEWVDLLNTRIRPNFALCGHIHRIGVVNSVQQFNEKGFNAPIIFGGRPADQTVEGCGVTLQNGFAEVIFNNGGKEPLQTQIVPYHDEI